MEPIVPTLDRLAACIAGAEGPCVSRDGRIFMVSPNEGRIIEVLGQERTRDLANTGGVPAGLQLDRNGSFWVADMKLGILRVTMDGMVRDGVREFEGKPIRGCNDLAFDSLGNLYFSAPAGSSLDNPCGEMFCRMANGDVRRLDGGFAFCNGTAVSADDRLLLVAETFTKRLWAYDLVEPGTVGAKRLWSTLTGKHRGGPDGMDFDASGCLVVANWGGGVLEVFRPDGTPSRHLRMPFAKPSNVHFEGPGSRNLLITEHDTHGLWRLDYGAPGQTQYGWQ